MLLNIVKRSKYRVSVDIQDEDGTIVNNPKLVNRFNEKEVEWLAKLNPDWTIPDVNKFLNDFCDDPDSTMTAFEIEVQPETLIELKNEPPVDNFTIYVREIGQPKESGARYLDPDPATCIREAFATPIPNAKELLIEWFGTDKLCCLDIDYHTIPLNERPSYEHLSTILSKIKPAPFCWHMSHGHGVKLYYTATPGFQADELAAVAGLRWSELDATSTFDLIKSTRHPLYARTRDKQPAPCSTIEDIEYVCGSSDLSSLRRLLHSEVDETDIQRYLDESGLSYGATLPHSSCPIDPGNSSDESKLSVYVGDKGIFCHRCYGRGLGKTAPGFISWASLIGVEYNSTLRTMVKNFCHLEHAKVVLSNLYPNVQLKILEIIYKVLMKLIHTPDDPRIKMAMVAGRGYIRTKGLWVTTDGLHPLADSESIYVKSLPSVMIPKEDGYTLDIPKVVAFQNSNDLEDYGYPDITFIRGCKIYGNFLPYRNENIKVVIRKEFRKCEPKYLKLSDRMPSEHAWELLDSTFPGIDHNYLKLLIAAKGASEGRLAQCPYLLITGPSASGKSTTPQIAAGICGDKAEEPIWVPQVDRFRQSLMDAARDSSYIIINEVFKLASHARLTPKQALDPLLSLTEDSRSHVMYVGSVPFGRLPVFVLTDINFPTEVETDIQLSRRFTFYRLQARNYWSDSLINLNIRPHEFRLISFEHALAADTILSEIVDEFFRVPTSLDEISRRLYIPTLEQYSEEIDSSKNNLKRFYELVCNAPKLMGTDLIKKPGNGWKRIDRLTQSPLNECWMDICDGNTNEDWGKSRLVESQDWSKILGEKIPIMVDIKRERSSIVFVRFRSADSAKHPTWINGEKLE